MATRLSIWLPCLASCFEETSIVKRALILVLKLIHALAWFPLDLFMRDRLLRPFRKKRP